MVMARLSRRQLTWTVAVHLMLVPAGIYAASRVTVRLASGPQQPPTHPGEAGRPT